MDHAEINLNFDEKNFITDTDFNSLFKIDEVNNSSSVVIINNTSYIFSNIPKCCNCKKIKCNKLYCKCVATNRICSNCDCVGCENRGKKINVILRKSINCNCKKSECVKQYCACHSKGKTCNKSCNCVNCENI